MRRARQLHLANRLAELGPLRDAVDALLLEEGHPEPVRFEVNVALEEVFTNVVHYAYPDDGGAHEIDVALALEDGVLQASVEDSGVPFDPLGVPPPDLEAPLEERVPGGLGIFLAKQFMDTLEYSREGGRNVLTLTKRLGPQR